MCTDRLETKEISIMRAVVQRVSNASVRVNDTITGAIDQGLLVLLGVGIDDTDSDATFLADKIINLRIFEDEAGKMNLSLKQVQGQLLVVSQFTLLGDCRNGRRPSFGKAAPPEKAESLYNVFIAAATAAGITPETGKFRAMMDVSLTNSGPVTLVIDSSM